MEEVIIYGVLMFFFFYYIVPILVTLVFRRIENFLWDNFGIDFNITEPNRTISRKGWELIGMLNRNNINIYDVLKDERYTKDQCIDFNALKNDINNGKYFE